jgi:hypothetical protein
MTSAGCAEVSPIIGRDLCQHTWPLFHLCRSLAHLPRPTYLHPPAAPARLPTLLPPTAPPGFTIALLATPLTPLLSGFFRLLRATILYHNPTASTFTHLYSALPVFTFRQLHNLFILRRSIDLSPDDISHASKLKNHLRYPQTNLITSKIVDVHLGDCSALNLTPSTTSVRLQSRPFCARSL